MLDLVMRPYRPAVPYPWLAVLLQPGDDAGGEDLEAAHADGRVERLKQLVRHALELHTQHGKGSKILQYCNASTMTGLCSQCQQFHFVSH